MDELFVTLVTRSGRSTGMVWLIAAAAGMVVSSALLTLSIVQCKEDKRKNSAKSHRRAPDTSSDYDPEGAHKVATLSEPITSETERRYGLTSLKKGTRSAFIKSASHTDSAQETQEGTLAESHRARKKDRHRQKEETPPPSEESDSMTGGIEKTYRYERSSQGPSAHREPVSLYRPVSGQEKTNMNPAVFYPTAGGPAPMIEVGMDVLQYAAHHAKLVLRLKKHYEGFAPDPKPYQFPVDLSLSESQR